jgi:uncharacterized protein YcbK (DUF882 family)
MGLKLTENFTLSEFACNCGCGIENEYIDNITKVAEQWQKVRDIVGKPLVVLSGIRCIGHNIASGGVEGSRHLVGKAADVTCPGIPSSKLFEIARSLFRGCIWYKGNHFVHGDVRTSVVVCYIQMPDGGKVYI